MKDFHHSFHSMFESSPRNKILTPYIMRDDCKESLPSPETNSKKALKINGWKMIHFLLRDSPFSGAVAVRFRE